MSGFIPLLSAIPLPGDEGQEPSRDDRKCSILKQMDVDGLKNDDATGDVEMKTIPGSRLLSLGNKETSGNSKPVDASQTIVDELFKDFLANKIKKEDEIGEMNQKDPESANSMEEMSRLLDDEINLIHGKSQGSHDHKHRKRKRKERDKGSKTKHSDMELDADYVENSEKSQKDLIPTLFIGEESSNLYEGAGDEKKSQSPTPAVGIKLEISKESIAWITSGETLDQKKKKILEEGEVASSSTDDNSDEGDDESEGEVGGNVAETVSVSDSDKESKSSKSRKKKKKKHKHKKKKKHKSSKEKNSKDKDRTKDRDDRKEKPKDRYCKTGEKRHHSRSRSRSPKRSRRSRSRSHGRRSRSVSKDRDKRDRHLSRDEWDAKNYRHGRTRDKRQSRSRSTSRSRENTRSEPAHDLRVKIDKAKLRKIAIANVLANMRGGASATGIDVATIKAGGKSVEELTDFCKKISQKEKIAGNLSSSDSEEELLKKSDDEGDEEFIHHPFKLRDPSALPNIVLNIRNAKQLPLMTAQAKASQQSQLRLQFPVSSGSHHRVKENDWVPVEKTTASTATSTTTSTTTTVGVPCPAAVGAVTNTVTTTTTTTAAVAAAEIASAASSSIAAESSSGVNDADKVFPNQPQTEVDISSIISQRLHAVRKLAENPYDVQALCVMHKAQEKASVWAQSKFLPGQYTGSTGVQTLTPQELAGPDKRNQAWAKKVEGNFVGQCYG